MKIIKIDYGKSIPDNFTGISEWWTGDKCWYKEGNFHREDGPAIEHQNGTKCWYKEGKLHRKDGPAIEYPNGDKKWYKEGKLHRLDGPAIIYLDGSRFWYKEEELHCLDGPAVELPDGRKYWYIEDNLYSPELLSELINFSVYLGKEKGQYNLEWLKFLTEKGIKELPIIPGMKEDRDFKKIFNKLKRIENK
jgi:hypothetical protein